MALDLEELKEKHDKAFLASEATRERAADDLVFYWLTQWDEDILSESQLAYRGEFNILRKAGRQILSDLETNPVQVDFEPKATDKTDVADVLDGIYRTDDTSNSSIDAYEVGKQEAVVCGAGAWKLYTEYETLQPDDDKQVIRRQAINEANNVVFWDPDAVMLDKSDAKYVSILTPYTREAYKELVKELTGEEVDDIDVSSFKTPESVIKFPWVTGRGDRFYVAEFYHKDKIETHRLSLVDPFGNTEVIWADDLTDQEDKLLDQGFNIVGAKKFKRWRVTKYIASGAEILDVSVIPGNHLPVIPVYGERAIVEGEEHWEGISRLAKDPQRLRNFVLSYLAEIASRSPRPKPIFFPEQVQGHEDMYAATGIDNNYPYYLQNRKSIDGEDLPIGPVAVMPEQAIPSPLVALAELTREAVEDVANPGTPQDVADPDISGKAVLALQARLDMQSVVYQTHFKHAKRWDAMVYASMASEVYDTPRSVRLTLPDGTKKDDQVMKTSVNNETGDIELLNDIRDIEFDVFSKIGPGYTTQKEQTVDKLTQMMQNMDAADPTRRILQLKILQLMDGVDFDDIRDYVKKQLVLMGVRKPETPEEEEIAAQAAAEANKPDANTLLAMAEMEKAKADQMQASTGYAQAEVDAQNEGMKRQIEQFKAMTDRMEALIKAQEAKAGISKAQVEETGQELENAAKVIQLRNPFADMSTEDIYKKLGSTGNAAS
jgi:hypothetical protein